MTRRGFWFLSIAGGSLIVSIVLPNQFSVTLLSLSAVLWFAVQWSWVQLRADLVVGRLRVSRTIDGQPIREATLWEGKSARMEVRVDSPHRWRLGMVTLYDRMPTTVDCLGQSWHRADLDRDHPAMFSYSVRSHAAGTLRFEGMLVDIADPARFFTRRVFVADTQETRILPNLIDTHKSIPARKRTSRLPVHGVHRHRRPGAGSELLELRDYRSGDPPRSIAWKISARRDKLTAKDVESEVPVRCTIVVDHSDSVRLGWPGPTALTQSVRLAAALARQSIDRRDPVGLCLVDGPRAVILPPAVGKRHETRLLTELCRIASQPPGPSPVPPDRLVEPVLKALRETRPDLLDPRLNRRLPWWDWGASPVGFIVRLSLILLSASAVIAIGWLIVGRTWGIPVLLALLGVIVVCAVVYRRLFIRPQPRRPGMTRPVRRTIASAVAATSSLGPAGISLILENDDAFSQHVQEFLIRQQAYFPRPLHDPQGRFVFADPAKIPIIARALLRAVAHARDNELFVLLVDLLEHRQHWKPLMEAIKVARSRHHDVLLLCPWPADLDLPSSVDRELPRTPDVERDVRTGLIEHYFRGFDAASAELSRLGIPLIPLRMPDAVDLVLRRIDTIRQARIPVHR
jgi:uncharacterized protein (DUF58 family)